MKNEIDRSSGVLDALLASEGVKKKGLKVTAPASAGAGAGTEHDVEHESWGGLLLPGAVKMPDIPASLLPGWAGAMVSAIAKDTQTPEAASVVLALSMIATCVQRRWEVAPGHGNGYTEPLCLWTLAALPSGSRKTAIVKALSAPLLKWEKLMSDRMRAEVARNEAARRVSKKRIEALEAKAAKADDKKERDTLREEIRAEIETTSELHEGLLVDWALLPCSSQEHGYKLVESIRRKLVEIISGVSDTALASSGRRH